MLYALFGGWLLAAVVAGAFFLLRKFMSVEIYLLLWIVLMVLAIRLMNRWLRSRGSVIFANL